MTTGSQNRFPKVILVEAAEDATPTPTGEVHIKADSATGLPYAVDDAGTSTPWGGGGGVATLDDLTDVATAGQTTGDVLTYDGAQWEPAAPAGGGSSAFAADLNRWHIGATASTASHATTITAAAAGQRLIVVVGSYARDVNTPTCTNVTFTEVMGVSNGTATYLSVYVGVVAGGSSGTTVTVTAGSSNQIFATVLVVSDALTPTSVDTSSVTGSGGETVTATSGKVDCSIGDIIVMAWATNNATSGPNGVHCSSPIFMLPMDSLPGLRVAIGMAGAAQVQGFMTSAGLTGSWVIGIVAIS